MLVAILLVALGTIIAAAVAYESAMNARRGSATLSFDEALLVGQGAEALAAFGLKTWIENNTKPSTPGGSAGDITPGQRWAQPVGPIEVVPGVTLEASLEDMQGRFNLNWLVPIPGAGPNGQNPNNPNGIPTSQIPGMQGSANPGAVRAFTKLMELVHVDPKWADMIVDWIDSDNQPQNQGGEDSLYLGQNPPYLTANRYITSTTELLALPGFGRENFMKLAPYISALPPSSKFNICTAPGAVLDAFSTQQVQFSTDPEGLAKSRQASQACFPEKQVYTQILGADVQAMSPITIDTASTYFRLSSLITIGSTEFNLYSLLLVEQGTHYVHPVLRSFSPD